MDIVNKYFRQFYPAGWSCKRLAQHYEQNRDAKSGRPVSTPGIGCPDKPETCELQKRR
jgi:hypothetical protein